MKQLARSSRGVHTWRVAKALGLPPGEVEDRLAHGDLQVVFAFHAEAEDQRRENNKWQDLAKLIKSGFESLGKALRR